MATPSLPLPEPGSTISAFTSLSPGTVPLLFQLPDGSKCQVDVAHNASVAEVKRQLSGCHGDPSAHPAAGAPDATTQDATQSSANGIPQFSIGDPSSFELSFGRQKLDPESTIDQYNIPQTYEHAGTLLQMISSSALPPEKRPEAIESANRVVYSVSKGVKDMEKLFEAASKSAKNLPSSVYTSSTAVTSEGSESAPISAFALGLSHRLPDIFPVEGTDFVMDNAMDVDTPQESQEQPSLQNRRSSLILQPSIAHLREMRRKNAAYKSEEKWRPSVILGGTSSSTWFEDLNKTLEVDALKRSGVLAKSKEGASISRYLDDLQTQAEKEGEHEMDTERSLKMPSSGGSTDVEDGDHGQKPLEPGSKHEPGVSQDALERGISKLKVESGPSRMESTDAIGGGPSGTPSRPAGPCPSASAPFVSPRSQAVPIAPAPSNRPYPALPAATGFTPAIQKKRRGRKRKHPEMTEEQRKLARMEQNRRSARLSRVRKKMITQEYEEKMSKLVNENSSLKEQVAALNQRLNFMQGLLTVSVTPGRLSSLTQHGAGTPPQAATTQGLSQPQQGVPMRQFGLNQGMTNMTNMANMASINGTFPGAERRPGF